MIQRKVLILKVSVPKNVSIAWGKDFIKIKGPYGEIVKKKAGFKLYIKENVLYFVSLRQKRLGVFYFSLIRSMIFGVSKGFRSRLHLVGVGFRASIKKNENTKTSLLSLKLGYSHEVTYTIPNDIKIRSSKSKGILLVLEGNVKQRLKQTAMEIKMLRRPDIYKGKGIHFYKEVIRLKKGKVEHR